MRQSTYKYLESELFEYNYIGKHINKVREDIRNPYRETDENIGGGKSNRNVSVVEQTATRLLTDKRLIQLERMKFAIEKVYDQSNDDERKLMELYYFKKPRLLTPDGVAEQLSVSRRQFYNMKKSIVCRLADELGILH